MWEEINANHALLNTGLKFWQNPNFFSVEIWLILITWSNTLQFRIRKNGNLGVSVKGNKFQRKKERKEKPVKKEDWIAKTKREKRTAEQTRWRSKGRLLLFEDVLWDLMIQHAKTHTHSLSRNCADRFGNLVWDFRILNMYIY